MKLSEKDIIQTLNGKMGTGGGNTPMVLECFSQDEMGENVVRGETYVMTTGNHMTISEDRTSALLSRDYKDPQCVSYASDGKDMCAIEERKQHYIVRRLTPLECERLQGFPDYWTEIGGWTDKKGRYHKESTDGARYKALGNSIAIPPWFYVLQRLSVACGTDKTMASLFDGIGGFPLIWEGLHGEGSCVRASEIEDFPIAVTKEHFSNETGIKVSRSES